MSKNKRLFILEKAIELFSTHGFEAVSIQDITDYCGISKGAFYLSFKSKDELMIAILEHLLTSVYLIFDRAVSNVIEPQLRLQKLFEELLSFMRMNRGIATYFIYEPIHMHWKNKDLVCVLAKYEQEIRTVLGQLLEAVYSNKIAPIKQDLILCLTSLFKMYFEYVCLRGLDIDTSMLARSLVEKTNILANAEYKYALHNEHLEILSQQHKFGEEELSILKARMIQDIKERLNEEINSLLKHALEQVKLQLEHASPEPTLLYAYSSLLREYTHYEDLAIRLRSYTKTMFPL